MELKVIAHFKSPFGSKFGVPRQSGLVKDLRGFVVMEEEYRNPDYLRGIESFDYLWLMWQFNANEHASTSPLVRPPVLGGNEKRGVFATRSPYRPNPIGLSSVKLEKIDWEPVPTLTVLGADLMDNTPIYDIKPYIPYSDAHPEAHAGFADEHSCDRLQVEIPHNIQMLIHKSGALTQQDVAVLCDILAHDPRPRYHDDPKRVYGMTFMRQNIQFIVDKDKLIVTNITD